MNDKEIDWIQAPIVGAALNLKAREQTIDSSGNPIEDLTYYRVGKHKSGKVAIIKIEQSCNSK